MGTYLFWVIIVAVSLVSEIMTAQLVSIWFVAGGTFALITSLFTESLPIQIAVFIFVSLIMIALVRPFVKNILKFKTYETNSDRLIGKTALVVESIDNKAGKGAVNIDGLTWSARSKDGVPIDIEEPVRIDSISGVKLIVHKI